jgi:hypothetical protein
MKNLLKCHYLVKSVKMSQRTFLAVKLALKIIPHNNTRNNPKPETAISCTQKLIENTKSIETTQI